MGKFSKEFKEFVMRGNVLDLAVGVIIGGAFQTIVTSLCDDVIMPSVNWLIAKCAGIEDINQVTKVLNVGPIAFGKFVSAIINFLIMALIIFLMVKGINKMMSIGKKPVTEAPTTKKCPFCLSEIDINATRCAHCTSVLEMAEEALKEEAPAEKSSKKAKK